MSAKIASTRGRGTAPRQAHNLEVPVRIRAPQPIIFASVVLLLPLDT